MKLANFQKALQILSPFIAESKIHGPMPGVLIDSGKGYMYSARSFGEGLYLLDEEIAEKAFVLPYSIVSRIAKFSPDSKWSKFVEKDGKISTKVGRITVSFPIEEVLEFEPTLCDSSGVDLDLDPGFFEKMGMLSGFMCQDDRKLSLYGMFIGDDGLYTCDNIRIVFMKCNVSEALRGCFIPYGTVFVLQRLGKMGMDAVRTDSVLQLTSAEVGVFKFAQSGAEFPKVQSFVEKAQKGEERVFTIMEEKKEIEIFRDIFSSMIAELGSSILNVVLHSDCCKISASSLLSSTDIEIPIEFREEAPVEFSVNGGHFLEGMLLFNQCMVAPTWVRFWNDEMEYIILKAVPGKK